MSEIIKDAPILFQDWAVCAILKRIKTQTRRLKCNYKIGQKLWVRETWQKSEYFHYTYDQYVYRADESSREFANEYGIPWKPSIFMPHEATRIFLKVKDIRTERIQDISEKDAMAEGIVFQDHGKNEWGNQLPGWGTNENVKKGFEHCLSSAKFAFGNLWNSLTKNPELKFEANPKVFVIEFELLEVLR